MRQCDINFVYYIIKMIGNAAYVKSFNSLSNNTSKKRNNMLTNITELFKLYSSMVIRLFSMEILIKFFSFFRKLQMLQYMVWPISSVSPT